MGADGISLKASSDLSLGQGCHELHGTHCPVKKDQLLDPQTMPCNRDSLSNQNCGLPLGGDAGQPYLGRNCRLGVGEDSGAWWHSDVSSMDGEGFASPAVLPAQSASGSSQQMWD